MSKFSLPVETNCYMRREPPTPAETRTALEGSIAKWQRIVDGSDIDRGASNCSLCSLFYFQFQQCNGCPVSEATGDICCRHSPYVDYKTALRNTDPRVIDFARKELDFLKGLL